MPRQVIGFDEWLLTRADRKECRPWGPKGEGKLQAEIIAEVRRAVMKLSRLEREIVERYYYQGQTLKEISRELSMNKGVTERLQRNIVKKLRRYLAPFVKERFGTTVPQKNDCVICNSLFRREIESLIRTKSERETWRRILRRLGEEYHLEIKSPQTIMSHLKFHGEGESDE